MKTTPEVHEVDSLGRVIAWGVANCSTTTATALNDLSAYWNDRVDTAVNFTGYAA